jgi:hypothetical protein
LYSFFFFRFITRKKINSEDVYGKNSCSDYSYNFFIPNPELLNSSDLTDTNSESTLISVCVGSTITKNVDVINESSSSFFYSFSLYPY